ncbi:hypothetical protein EVAR_98119_1 [Eumeta japonica]|uniref:Uncharacterized protein n=1 Tax=Eumeta variegata TaxID=151549 RepID=A0A4C2A6S0_EUMVA|nr:hypothetical protein EVAR_98119_1 [Eumeta japonica]
MRPLDMCTTLGIKPANGGCVQHPTPRVPLCPSLAQFDPIDGSLYWIRNNTNRLLLVQVQLDVRYSQARVRNMARRFGNDEVIKNLVHKRGGRDCIHYSPRTLRYSRLATT